MPPTGTPVLNPYMKPLVWSICVGGGLILGHVIDGKSFGPLEGTVSGLIVGSVATAYLDKMSLDTVSANTGA